MKVSLVLFALLLFINSCGEDSPVTPPEDLPKQDTILISLEHQTHKSISLRIKTTINDPKKFISVYRLNNNNPTLLANYPIIVSDTVLTDDNNGTGLELNTSYSWYAVSTDSTGIRDSSNTFTITTLDTTTHSYTFQQFSDRYYYGVWGLDENNVWVTGNEIMRWNGTEWIKDESMGGMAIYGFTGSDIWAVGGGVAHFDGTKWTRKESISSSGTVTIKDSVLYFNSEYYSVWGTSSSNMYFGSINGKIIHWNGTKASLTEVNASNSILDIWGFSENDIYAVAGNELDTRGQLWHYDGISWKVIRKGGFPSGNDTRGPFSSVWGKHPSEIYLLADKVEIKRNTGWTEDINPNVYMLRLRGTNSNNVFICGHFGKLYHYNGMDWREYTGITSENLRHLFVTENKVFLAGSGGIFIGQKQ
jgi:hypothetical protein